MRISRIILPLFALAAAASAGDRLPLQDDLWREFDLYRGRLLDLAKAIPEDKYDFRPAKDVRSIKEVIVHAAVNNYMILDMMGVAIPKDLYPDMPATPGMDRQRAVARRGGKLEKEVTGKQ